LRILGNRDDLLSPVLAKSPIWVKQLTASVDEPLASLG